MSQNNHGHWYLLWFPVLLFVSFGLLKIHSLNKSDRSLRSSLRGDQNTVRELRHKAQQTTLANHEKQVASQGADLYRALPQADRRIKSAIRTTYGSIHSQKDLDHSKDRIDRTVPGSFATTLLKKAQPQASQFDQHPMNPLATYKNVHVTDRFTNYNQGYVYIWTDVSYTVPSHTIMSGRKMTFPATQGHDYYLSSYQANGTRFDSLANTHNQDERGND